MFTRISNRFDGNSKRRRGTGKAMIAATRKLTGIIFDTLKNDWVFEDFPNFAAADSGVKK